MTFILKASFFCLLTLGSTYCFAFGNPSYYSSGDTVHSSNDFYKIHKKLGEGFFGEVYFVENSVGQKFALKTSKFNDWTYYLMDPSREFSLGQLLDHPNIIKSIELFTSKSSTEVKVNNLILELVHGNPLLDTKPASFSHEIALDHMIHFCEALQYALTLDLMHMDLHGGNIMITKDKSAIKIVDIASFNTFKELMGHISLPKSSSKSLNPLSIPSQMARPQLEKFFLENPQLLKKILNDKDIMRTNTSEINKLANLSFSVNPSLEEDVRTIKVRNVISHHYFDKITEICIQVLRKSTLGKEERIILRGKIKNLAWEYDEEVEEGCNLPLEDYIKRLIDLIQTVKDTKASLKSAA